MRVPYSYGGLGSTMIPAGSRVRQLIVQATQAKAATPTTPAAAPAPTPVAPAPNLRDDIVMVLARPTGGITPRLPSAPVQFRPSATPGATPASTATVSSPASASGGASVSTGKMATTPAGAEKPSLLPLALVALALKFAF